ncbi:MAG: hypothetical protein SPK75_02210 [Victivallales bacterium]|nr:hypothetical protein [Victivallales bacterium]
MTKDEQLRLAEIQIRGMNLPNVSTIQETSRFLERLVEAVRILDARTLNYKELTEKFSAFQKDAESKFQQYYNGGGNNGGGGGNSGGGGAVDPDPNDGGPDEINSNHYRPTQTCTSGYTTIASFTTNPDNPEWDLSDYKRAGKGYSKWSIRETSHGLEYASGSISSSGRLQGLPRKFTSTYDYDGYMELAVC